MRGTNLGRHWRAVTTENETLRLETLHKLGAIEANPDFDCRSIVALAAEITEAPVAMISLVDADRQVFRAAVGTDLRDTPKEISFCQYTIQTPQTMVVPDALRDPRFQDSPLVTGPTSWRFYAGTPLNVHGHNIGALCVVDRRPRQLDLRKQAALEVLAGLAASVLQTQFNLRQLEAKVSALSKLQLATAA